MQTIHKEFQKTHIKKLYQNPIWTDRAFWVAVVAVENQTQIETRDVLRATREYLTREKLLVPSIDWVYWMGNQQGIQ